MFARRGFTLVELLVVIMIVLAVTALAIGVSVPDVQSRRLREAARQINAHFQGAKARAAETGRAVAVLIQPDPADPRAAFTLKYAEVPPPYAGDQLNSVARFVQPASGVTANTGVVEVADVGWQGVNPQDGIVRPGDLIQFNHQGHYYEITAVDPSSNRWAIRPAGGTTGGVRNPGDTVGLRYRVFRQPIASAGSDLELPESVVVDLSASGPGSGVFRQTNQTRLLPVVLVFSPGGSIVRSWADGQNTSITRPFYLLVGNVEGVGPPYANLASYQSIWVAINHQTGLVTSVQNAAVNVQGQLNGSELNTAREFARKAQSLGGRSG